MNTQTTITRRPVQSIYQRHLQRERSMTQTFPPDFVHGGARLDELYDTWGDWAEKALFVRKVKDEKGRVVSTSVAYFDDWFLTLEHSRSAEVDMEAWLAEVSEDRVTIVELVENETVNGPHHIQIALSQTSLQQQEYEVLHVTREEGLSFWEGVETDLLSLVCLCARLGRVA